MGVPVLVVGGRNTLVEVRGVVSLIVTGSTVPLVVIGNKLLRLLVKPPVESTEEDARGESVVIGVVDVVTIGMIAIDEAVVEESPVADVATDAKVLGEVESVVELLIGRMPSGRAVSLVELEADVLEADVLDPVPTVTLPAVTLTDVESVAEVLCELAAEVVSVALVELPITVESPTVIPELVSDVEPVVETVEDDAADVADVEVEVGLTITSGKAPEEATLEVVAVEAPLVELVSEVEEVVVVSVESVVELVPSATEVELNEELNEELDEELNDELNEELELEVEVLLDEVGATTRGNNPVPVEELADVVSDVLTDVRLEAMRGSDSTAVGEVEVDVGTEAWTGPVKGSVDEAEEVVMGGGIGTGVPWGFTVMVIGTNTTVVSVPVPSIIVCELIIVWPTVGAADSVPVVVPCRLAKNASSGDICRVLTVD